MPRSGSWWPPARSSTAASCRATIGGESTSDLLREARYDNAVKAVVLRVDSPGGSEFASEKILREVQALRKAGKPVVVSMSSYAASGGYYIAAAANQIFASPTTITGSIGVFSYIPTFQRTLGENRRQGRRHRHHAARRRHALRSCLGPGHQAGAAGTVDHAYQQFLRRVADGRKKPVEDVDKIAQGRVWAGVDAQRIGLVDHLGGLKDATDAAAKLAELGSDYDVDYIETELSLEGAAADADPLAGGACGPIGGADSAAYRHRARSRSVARAGSRHRPAQGSARAVLILLVPANRAAQ